MGYIQILTNIARFTGKTLIAAAGIGLDALAILTAGLTLRHTVYTIRSDRVSDATFLHDLLLDDGRGFVDRARLDAVRRAARGNTDTPLLVPLLVRFLARYRDSDC